MLLQGSGVFRAGEGLWSAPQKNECSVLFLNPAAPPFECAGSWVISPGFAAAGVVSPGPGAAPTGPMTGGSFAHSHSTFTRDLCPKLNKIPAASFQEELIPTSYKPLASQ